MYKGANYIVFDCETGGFDPDKNPIHEIAMISLDGKTLKEINRLETYIKPYDDLITEDSALKVSGLKMRDVERGLDKKEAVKMICAFMDEIKGSKFSTKFPILVGHNVDFDISFLKSLLERSGKDLSKFANRVSVDTLADARRHNPDGSLISGKLGDVCERMGIKISQAHRAMPDTIATAELFRKFTQLMRDGSNKNVDDNSKTKRRDKFQF